MSKTCMHNSPTNRVFYNDDGSLDDGDCKITNGKVDAATSTISFDQVYQDGATTRCPSFRRRFPALSRIACIVRSRSLPFAHFLPAMFNCLSLFFAHFLPTFCRWEAVYDHMTDTLLSGTWSGRHTIPLIYPKLTSD